MSIVGEVRDGIALVAEGIDNIRTIHAAIKDGKDYIATQHAEVAADLVAMCREMRGTLDAIAVGSAIITHFRFTVAGEAIEREPARFNEHLMSHKAQARRVEEQLNALRGKCSVIAGHAEALEAAARRRGLSSLASLFGLRSKERELEVATALRRIYNDEMQFHHNVYGMRTVLQRALEAVEGELGPPGTMNPANVPRAAAVLGEYADAFSRLESDANYGALQLQELANDLQR
jgi:antitoxin (DNA-binding transcriptional repressor) of toxin-antitoxin stability system